MLAIALEDNPQATAITIGEAPKQPDVPMCRARLGPTGLVLMSETERFAPSGSLDSDDHWSQ